MNYLLIIPFQDYTPYLVSAAIGVAVGLVILIIIALPLVLWLRRRQKSRRAAAAAQEATVIPPLPSEGEPTQPSFPTVEIAGTVPVMAVGQPQTLPIAGQRPEGISWRIAGLTDVGLKRDLNEDNMLMFEGEMPDLGPYGLYAVADGMGGHEKGEVASQLTLETIQQQMTEQLVTPNDAPFGEWLKAAAVAANEVVLTRQQPDNPERKMGSTLVMALVAGQEVHIANVGDSRAYHLTSESITQISEDHSLVERLVQIGQITREEARVHRQKNVIYNTIGDKPNLQVSLYHQALQPGDRLLLCSDGLSNMLPDEEILAISQQYAAPAEACQKMVEAAKVAGGVDNITAIIVQMDAA